MKIKLLFIVKTIVNVILKINSSVVTILGSNVKIRKQKNKIRNKF